MESFVKQVLLSLILLKTTVDSCGSNTSTSPLFRLNGLLSPVVGNLEICINESWREVITDVSRGGSWTLQDSIVICKSLGYQSAANVHLEYYETRFSLLSSATSCVAASRLKCTGREKSIDQCKEAAAANQFAHVDCDTRSNKNSLIILCKDPSPGEVRLVGSSDSSKGIVEVYSDYYGWSTLCTDDWDDNDASVVCQSLGYTNGQREDTIYPFLNLPMKRYNNFKCDGNENSILDCSHNGPYPAGGCRSAFPARLSCTMDGESYFTLVLLLVIVAIVSMLIVIFFIAIIFLRQKKCKNSKNYEKLETGGSQSNSAWLHKSVSATIPPKYV